MTPNKIPLILEKDSNMKTVKLLKHSIPLSQTQRKIIKMKERSTLFSNMKPQIYSLMNKEGM